MNKIFLMIITAGFLYSCSGNSDETSSPEKRATNSEIVKLDAKQLRNAGIVSESPVQKEMAETLKLNGVIDVPPGNNVIVSLPYGGYLKSSKLIPGMKVTKGQVIATVEDQQYVQLQQDYLSAKNRMKVLESDYNRQKSLNETKASSDKIVQQSQSDFMNEKILVRSLAEKLRIAGISPESLNENTISRSVSVRAPITGYVTAVNAEIGKYINPADELFAITDPAKTQVKLTVFEKDAAKIQQGQKISFSLNNDPSKTYSATVSVISPFIGQNRGTVVFAEPQSGSGLLIPGIFVNAEISVGAQNVNTLPSEAIVEWESKKYVFVELSEGNYKMLSVATGIETGNSIEIVSELPQGKIVTKNAYTLLMKLKNQE